VVPADRDRVVVARDPTVVVQHGPIIAGVGAGSGAARLPRHGVSTARPPPTILGVSDAAELLQSAVDAAARGDVPGAIELLRECVAAADVPDAHRLLGALSYA